MSEMLAYIEDKRHYLDTYLHIWRFTL